MSGPAITAAAIVAAGSLGAIAWGRRALAAAPAARRWWRAGLVLCLWSVAVVYPLLRAATEPDPMLYAGTLGAGAGHRATLADVPRAGRYEIAVRAVGGGGAYVANLELDGVQYRLEQIARADQAHVFELDAREGAVGSIRLERARGPLEVRVRRASPVPWFWIGTAAGVFLVIASLADLLARRGRRWVAAAQSR